MLFLEVLGQLLAVKTLYFDICLGWSYVASFSDCGEGYDWYS
jgi:hypothetical protein